MDSALIWENFLHLPQVGLSEWNGCWNPELERDVEGSTLRGSVTSVIGHN